MRVNLRCSCRKKYALMNYLNPTTPSTVQVLMINSPVTRLIPVVTPTASVSGIWRGQVGRLEGTSLFCSLLFLDCQLISLFPFSFQASMILQIAMSACWSLRWLLVKYVHNYLMGRSDLVHTPMCPLRLLLFLNNLVP